MTTPFRNDMRLLICRYKNKQAKKRRAATATAAAAFVKPPHK